MKHTTFNSCNEPQSTYTVQHNLDSIHVIVNVQVQKDNGWWSWPVSVHHIDTNTVIIDVIKPVHVRVTFLSFDE
jgi:hypothetical protein